MNLGQQRVEFLLDDCSQELLPKLHEAISGTSYVDKEDTEVTSKGSLICRILPTKKLKFRHIIQRIIGMIVTRIEHHDKKSGKSPAKSQRSQKSKSKKGYRHRGALAT